MVTHGGWWRGGREEQSANGPRKGGDVVLNPSGGRCPTTCVLKYSCYTHQFSRTVDVRIISCSFPTIESNVAIVSSIFSIRLDRSSFVTVLATSAVNPSRGVTSASVPVAGGPVGASLCITARMWVGRCSPGNCFVNAQSGQST